MKIFNEIIDPLYGKIKFPSFINKLLVCPEILRLKEIRMSNINFINFTGFSDSTRFEHSIGTAFLAHKMTQRWNIDMKDKLEIITAALFHDIATPPFGHAVESVYKERFNFNHEVETAKIILGQVSKFRKTNLEPIYAGEYPKLAEEFGKTKNPKLSIKNVFFYTQGKGKFGKIIKGKIDLDNIDNVIRSAFHIGLQIDKDLPINLARSFMCDKYSNITFRHENTYLIKKWLDVRDKLYMYLLLNTMDLNRESMLKYTIKKAVELNIMKKENWRWTDNELISRLTNPKRMRSSDENFIAELANRVRLRILFKEVGLFWISDPKFYSLFKNNANFANIIENELSNLLKNDIVISIIPDKRSRKIDNIKFFIKKESLFQSTFNEKNANISVGEQYCNLLFCIYSIKPTIIKRDDKGKAILDSNNNQIRYKLSELRVVILKYLGKYLKNPQNISIFNHKIF